MLKKRIVPCLDVKNGRTVKGINFVNLVDAGDPVELAIAYAEGGADELVFLDITASYENRDTQLEWVRAVAENINIPFTVGGGVGSVDDAGKILGAGADKIAINSAAVKRPTLVSELANKYGSQCVVAAIDAKREGDDYPVYIGGGRYKTDLFLFEWAQELVRLGAGEILFTSMDHDGTKQGFSNIELAKLGELISVPVIASGGAGSIQDFIDVFTKGNADAALAASVFHFGEIPINELKKTLNDNNIPVRL